MPTVMVRPVRRFSGYQARLGGGAALRPGGVREPTQRVRRPPGSRPRAAAESIRGRWLHTRGRPGVRPHAWHRQSLHRSRDLPRLPRSRHDRPAPRGPCEADANRAVGLNSARAGAPANTDDWVVRSLRTDPSCSSIVLGMLDFVTVQPPPAATSRVAAVDSSCPRRTHRRRDVLYTSRFRQTRR